MNNQLTVNCRTNCGCTPWNNRCGHDFRANVDVSEIVANFDADDDSMSPPTLLGLLANEKAEGSNADVFGDAGEIMQAGGSGEYGRKQRLIKRTDGKNLDEIIDDSAYEDENARRVAAKSSTSGTTVDTLMPEESSLWTAEDDHQDNERAGIPNGGKPGSPKQSRNQRTDNAEIIEGDLTFNADQDHSDRRFYI